MVQSAPRFTNRQRRVAIPHREGFPAFDFDKGIDMALRQNTNASTDAQFEDMEEMDQQAQAGNEAAVQATSAAAEPQTSGSQIEVRRTSALARPTASSVALQNVMSDVKDAFRVEYDSLPRLSAEQGSFTAKDTEDDLGQWVSLKLLSYQDNYVCSPNDSKAPVEYVLFSDDGKVDREGRDLFEHLKMLKEEGFHRAKISHRLILVGELLGTGSGEGPIGDLVQVDLSNTGRKSFQTYTLQASYKVAKGTLDREKASNLKLTATKAKTTNNEVYTKVVVGPAE